MIVRNTLQCLSCDSKIITRTQLGHKEMQEHSFQCPNCWVKITFILDLDPKNAGWSFRAPHNAEWISSEKGAISVLTFSDEIPVHIALPDKVSPFIATFGNFLDWEQYRDDETLRQAWVRHHWPRLMRCITHYERANWKLLDKELAFADEERLDSYGRLITIYNSIQGGLSKFTFNSPGMHQRITQRVVLANNISESLFDQLAYYYLKTGRIAKLWKEIASIRDSYMKNYGSFHPLIQMLYWRADLRASDRFCISDKRFDALRQLYIDCFETLCRLLVIGVGVEVIVHDKALSIPTKKRTITLEELESFPNGNKLDIITKYPIADLFVPFMDSSFRNGIGHHSAHYEQENDEIVFYDTKDSGTVTQKISYTAFCDRVLKLFAAFELGAMYHHSLHIHLGGELS